MARVRGRVELEAGIPAVACTLLLEGARPVLGLAPELATEMLVLATWAALAANQLDRIVDEIGPAIAHCRERATSGSGRWPTACSRSGWAARPRPGRA